MGKNGAMETPQAPRYRVPDDIAWIDGTEIGLGEELYLTRLPIGHTVRLKDTARMVWHHAVTVHAATESVAQLVGRPPSEIEAEIKIFLGRLVASRLLYFEPAPPSNSGV